MARPSAAFGVATGKAFSTCTLARSAFWPTWRRSWAEHSPRLVPYGSWLPWDVENVAVTVGEEQKRLEECLHNPFRVGGTDVTGEDGHLGASFERVPAFAREEFRRRSVGNLEMKVGEDVNPHLGTSSAEASLGPSRTDGRRRSRVGLGTLPPPASRAARARPSWPASLPLPELDHFFAKEPVHLGDELVGDVHLEWRADDGLRFPGEDDGKRDGSGPSMGAGEA